MHKDNYMTIHALKSEIERRKKVALEIYNTYKNNAEFTREDIVGKIQKELKIPRHRASQLALSLNLFPKRISTHFIPSGNPNTLICPKCGIEKNKIEFPKKGKDRNNNTRYSYCKSCHSDYQRIMHIKTQFNLTMDEYNKLGESCSICGRVGKKNRISVDHDHKTGLIRGRICSRCNRGIAWFTDNPELLESAAEYLRHPPGPDILGKEIYGRIGRVSKRRGKKKKYSNPEPVYSLDEE
jgi:Recombination endonuclease VII